MGVTDKCLYYKTEGDKIVVAGLYVDDLLVTGNDQNMVDEFFTVASEMDIKDLGKASKVLGIRVVQDQDEVTFDQESIIDLLEKHGLKNASPTRLPISMNYDEAEDGELLPSRSTNEQPVSVFTGLSEYSWKLVVDCALYKT
jgi:hypothetical protein